MQIEGKKIFLVEDNIGNQTIAKTLLQAHGATVVTHRSGQNVVEHLTKFYPIDLIILDLLLPDGVTGYDIFSAIRSREEFDDVPIIAMSVVDRSIAVPQAKRRGFSGFISKPINFQVFPGQIAQIISGDAIW